jgi:hypothetical protein
MKGFKTVLSLLLILSVVKVHAQDTLANPIIPDVIKAPLDKVSIGAGVGYEYGGIGANAIVYPQKNIGFFGGAGWYYVGFGYNAGVKLRAVLNSPSVEFIPFVEFMYGSNTYVYYKNNGTGYDFNKLFYNFTFGGGLDFRPNNSKLGFFTFALYVPLRSPDVRNYKDNRVGAFYPYLTPNKLYWLNASIGYKFILFR